MPENFTIRHISAPDSGRCQRPIRSASKAQAIRPRTSIRAGSASRRALQTSTSRTKAARRSRALSASSKRTRPAASTPGCRRTNHASAWMCSIKRSSARCRWLKQDSPNWRSSGAPEIVCDTSMKSSRAEAPCEGGQNPGKAPSTINVPQPRAKSRRWSRAGGMGAAGLVVREDDGGRDTASLEQNRLAFSRCGRCHPIRSIRNAGAARLAAGIFLAQRNMRHIADQEVRMLLSAPNKKFSATCQRACNGLRYCR